MKANRNNMVTCPKCGEVLGDDIAMPNGEVHPEPPSLLDEFGHRLSHDLREPLRKIVSFGDLLEYELGTGLSGDARDYLDAMKRSAGRLGLLVDRLLDYSRAAQGETSSGALSLQGLVEQLRGDFAGAIKATGAFVSLGYLPEIVGDREIVTKMLHEILDNAFRFHNPRRKGLMLQIWAELGRSPEEFTAVPAFMGKDLNLVEPARARWCRISVGDNGRGFPSEEHERIFSPFVRLGQTREDGGAGLGLAICRRLSERIGGQVSAVGRVDHGATVSICLPLKI